MPRMVLPLLLLGTAAYCYLTEQTSWVGGPGVQGPLPDLGDCFFTQNGSDWTSDTGSLTIAEFSVHTIGSIAMAQQAVAADMDSDGDMDVAAGNTGSVVLWLNDDGCGSSWTPVAVGTSCPDGTVSADDVDGDGDADLITGDKWFENLDGTGLSWSDHSTFSTGTVYSMRTADMDGDGDIDILVANGYTNHINMFMNLNGLGTSWENRQVCVPANMGSTIFPADIDCDGDSDFLIYTFDDPLFIEFCWMENVGGSGIIWESHLLSQYGYVWDIDAGDLDGDGDQDILTAGNNGVRAYLNSDGAGGSWQVVSLTGILSREVEAGDVDSDGDLDVVSSQYHSTTSFLWFENVNGSGAIWESHTVNGSFSSSDALCCQDINGDGTADPVICSSSSARWVFIEQDSAFVISSILDSGFMPAWGSISWNGETPQGTSLGIRVRSSADWTGMGDWSGTLFEPACLDSLLEDSTRYFQYAAVLETTEAGTFPVLQDVTVTWDLTGIGISNDEGTRQPSLSFRSNPCSGAPLASVYPGEQTEAELIVFDVSGRIVQRVEMENMMSGENQVLLNDLLPGVYIVKLVYGSNGMNQRIAVVR